MRRGLAVVLAGVVALSTAVSAPAEAAAKPRLGPLGYGKLKIGQKKKQARRTGMIVLNKQVYGGCTGFRIKGVKGSGGYISNKYGVVAIFAGKGVKTPQGIGLGAKLSQVKKKYPKIRRGPNIWAVAAPGGKKKKTEYWFLFDERNRVYELGLVSPKQHCFN